jgi:hypothetical protein
MTSQSWEYFGTTIRQSTGNMGCRIAVGLIHEVEKQGLKLGLAAFPYTSITFLSPHNPL